MYNIKYFHLIGFHSSFIMDKAMSGFIKPGGQCVPNSQFCILSTFKSRIKINFILNIVTFTRRNIFN